MKRSLLFLLVLLLAITGCKHKPRTIHKSVYYWQSGFNLSLTQRDSLGTMGIDKIYTRFFDVIYSDENRAVMPVADVRFNTKPDAGFEIVPVIFIRNAALLKTPQDSCASLAEKICRRIKDISSASGINNLNEVQLDCDWTPQTRPKFFAIVEACKQQFNNKIISCTIRLHQLKHYKTTGVPPCQRGMLMFYNMGSLTKLSPVNSIYDSATAQAYLSNFESYPLPLDAAVPLFSLAVLYHNNKPANTVSPGIVTNPVFQQVNGNLFVARKDTLIDLVSFKTGDKVKLDQARMEDCLKASKQITSYINNNNFSVSIFDIQPPQFFSYDTAALQKVYSTFR